MSDSQSGKSIWGRLFQMALFMLALLGSSQASAGYYICQGNGGVGEIAVAYGSACPYGGIRIYKTAEPVAFYTLTSSGNAVVFDPNSLTEKWNFGSVNTGSRSAAQTIRITNFAEASLGIASLPTTSTGYAVDTSGTSCTAGTTLAPGESCTVAVYFAPSAQGTTNGQLSINFRYFPSATTINLTGIGNQAASPTLTTYFVDCARQPLPGGVSCSASSPMGVLYSSSDVETALTRLGCTHLSQSGVYSCGSSTQLPGLIITYVYQDLSISRIIYLH